MRRTCLIVVLSMLTSITFVAPLMGQRPDRGVLTGVVLDPAGAAVPGATVVVRNEGTGVETRLLTNDTGSYTTPPLVLGTYTVRVEASGFKTHLRSGIHVSGGEVYRQDASLELGMVTQTVEVKAASEMINTTQAEITHNVDSRYYRDLPILMSGDVRLAESLLYIQPGYLPMRPNGDPMFRGSQFNSRINGGQTMATENWFDGAAFGTPAHHQQSHEVGPAVEGIREMRVITTSYSAQYGHTSGGFIEYTSKSGTNEFHGSLYEFLANDAFNARGFFAIDRTPMKVNNFGAAIGGPVVIPKVYNGRNKTFFFANLDWVKLRSGVLPGFGNTTPTDAFKQGNFSALLNTQNQVAVDVLGRPIYEGEIFNPATTRLVNGVPVRDGYGFDPVTGLPIPGQANIIPANDPLRSVVASRVVPLMVHPDRPGLAYNVAGNPSGDQTWVLNSRNWLFRVDHSFTDNLRSSTSFFWNRRPSIRNCGEVGGCKARYDPEVSPEKNDDYIGMGFFQRIVSHHANQQFDWIIRSNLVNHTTISWDRFFMGGIPLAGGVGWPEKFWGPNRGGLLDNTAGPPFFGFSGNIPYNTVGMAWQKFGFDANNRWQFVDDLTWLAGKHAVKIGVEYRHHQFPFNGWSQETGGNFNFNRLETGGYDAGGNTLAATGEPFASFLLGQTHAANFKIPDYPLYVDSYTAFFVNDEYKATSRLTLTLGLRFDYQGPKRELHDHLTSFDPSTPNPGAGGLPGALLYAGTGPGRMGSREFEHPKKDAWGPRFGFAYRLSDKDVIRGGYGMYFSGIGFSQFAATPNLGYEANPTAPNLTNGLYPAFYLDDGIPSSVIKRPPFVDPAFANGTSPVALAPDDLTLPRIQNWSITYQRQITANMLFDVSYVGTRGTRLVGNWRSLGTAANMNDPKILSLGAAVLGADINSPEAQAAGITPPYPGFQGNVAQALRPFPQYQNISYRNVPTGNSIYHSFQTKLERRFSQGLQFRVGYTWSRLKNNGAESLIANNDFGALPQNPVDTQKGEWGLSADDTPHSFLTGFLWQIPVGDRFKQGVGKVLLANWNVGGVLRYESARPLHIVMGNDLGGFLFTDQKRPNRVSGVDGRIYPSNFDPNRDLVVSRSAWEDPGPLKFGNAPRQDGTVRSVSKNYGEDFSLFKEFPFMQERWRLRFESQFGNPFNRTVFCDPNTNWTSSDFGKVFSQCNQPRTIQFALRLDF